MPKEALFYLDYMFRVAQVVLVIYVVITCPLDCNLTSNVCKVLFLYRRTILSPVAWLCWYLVREAARMLIRISHFLLLWLYNRVRNAWEGVSRCYGTRGEDELNVDQIYAAWNALDPLPVFWG